MKRLMVARTVEDVANFLLQHKIRFHYEIDTLTVGFSDSVNWVNIKYVSYHSISRKLVLMDEDFNEVEHAELK